MAYWDVIKADSPKGLWKLNEASGTTISDSSGNSNTGTKSTGTLAQTSIIPATTDTAYLGPGQSTMTAIQNSTASPTTVTTGWSIECTLKTPGANATGWQCLFCNGTDTGGGWAIGFGGTNDTGGHALSSVWVNLQWNADVTGAGSLSLSTVYFVIVTYDASKNLRWYVGTTSSAPSLVTQVISADPTAPSAGWEIGSETNAFPVDRGFAGTIQGVAVYSSQLSQAQVTRHYAGWLGDFTPGRRPNGAVMRAANWHHKPCGLWAPRREIVVPEQRWRKAA